MITMTINAPMFAGFYESVHYYTDMWYYFEKENHITEDDYEFDREGYERNVAEGYIEQIRQTLPAWIDAVRFKDIWSPQYYNYYTDRIEMYVDLVDDWQLQCVAFMERNKEWLTKQIKQDHSSHDGYISLMEDDYEEWVKIILNESNDMEQYHCIENYVECLLGYYILKECKWTADSINCYAVDYYNSFECYCKPKSDYFNAIDINGLTGSLNLIRSYDIGGATVETMEKYARENGMSLEEYTKTWWNEVQPDCPFVWEESYLSHNDKEIARSGNTIIYEGAGGQIFVNEYANIDND